MSNRMSRRTFTQLAGTSAAVLALGITPAFAETIKVAGIYTQPIQQKWDARLHQALVGGYPIGEVNRLFHAFQNGARSVNPDVQFKVIFIGSWYDPPKAKEAAFAQVEAGVDILYAERAGVVDAAREKGILAFGNVNDMNKEENGQDVVVTSALWHMENAISHAIGRVKAGTFTAENYQQWTMMQKGGASLAPYYEFEDRIPAEAKAKVEAVRAEIMAGSFTVTINDDEPKSTY